MIQITFLLKATSLEASTSRRIKNQCGAQSKG